MKTVTVQIGNSDDKLSQAKWSQFVMNIRSIIEGYAIEIHFTGSSLPFELWQNAAFIFVCRDSDILELKDALALRGKHYDQDSVAFTVGDTEFI